VLISEAAHNDYAARAMRFLHGHSRRFWYLHYRQAADLPLCARLHAAQARAIAAGDGKRAGEASDRLIDYTETFTRATVGVDVRPPRAWRERALKSERLRWSRPAATRRALHWTAGLRILRYTGGSWSRMHAMKTYEGKRSIDGLVVTIDGRPLPEHYEVQRFTKWGFEWTYEGASPQQLALAILYEHLGDKERAPLAVGAVHEGGGDANLDNNWSESRARTSPSRAVTESEGKAP
jgi:hypothetical protein